MHIQVILPSGYATLEGKTKKQFAWLYLKKHYPHAIPLKEQPYLFTKNTLVVTLDFQLAREHTRVLSEKRKSVSKKSTKK